MAGDAVRDDANRRVKKALLCKNVVVVLAVTDAAMKVDKQTNVVWCPRDYCFPIPDFNPPPLLFVSREGVHLDRTKRASPTPHSIPYATPQGASHTRSWFVVTRVACAH